MQGKVLGDLKTFKTEFEEVILRVGLAVESPDLQGSDRLATPETKSIGASVAEALRELIRPFFLRREKKEILELTKKKKDLPIVPSPPPSKPTGKEKIALTTRKNDFIIWLPMTDFQLELYRGFLNTEEVKNVRPPVSSLTRL